MVRDQIVARGVTDPRVLAALAAVPRELFVPADSQAEAYADRALPIGPAQTISQPFIVAYMTAHLDVLPRDRVLEVGTGSGYQAAVLAQLAGRVDTIEYDAALSAQARQRVEGLGIANVTFHVGDGSAGLAERAPFDRIMVTAGCPVVPDRLTEQLADGGVMLVPVGEADAQVLLRVSRRGGRTYTDRLLECRFVKLVGRYGWDA
ncbi:MAG: protein-L-isoaspartate(D-aspartate) O-methyltransferase [Phycisphaerales bacterium]|nr:protein-L-isoaspartate(D-aspartate) O-methyltransferase [Phycisphaerales bacterium]